MTDEVLCATANVSSDKDKYMGLLRSTQLLHIRFSPQQWYMMYLIFFLLSAKQIASGILCCAFSHQPTVGFLPVRYFTIVEMLIF